MCIINTIEKRQVSDLCFAEPQAIELLHVQLLLVLGHKLARPWSLLLSAQALFL